MNSNSDDELFQSPADVRSPFLSSRAEDGEDAAEDEDMEALTSMACALASVPVPDYITSMATAKAISKKKYGNRFHIDDDDDDAETGDLPYNDTSPSGVALAERTSQIMSNFQDYVSGIGGDSPGNTSSEILEGGVRSGREDESMTFSGSPKPTTQRSMAGITRSINKSHVLENPHISSLPRGSMQREWNSPHEGYVSKYVEDHLNDDVNNLHDIGFGDWSEEADPEANVVMVQRGQKYTYPILHAKKVKVGLINCVLVGAFVLAVSYGVSNSKNKAGKELGNQIDEVEEDLAMKQKGKSDLWQLDMEYEKRPQQENQPPLATIGPPTSKVEDAGKMVEMVLENEVNGDHKDPELTPEDILTIYRNALNKYQPTQYNRMQGWEGKTYMDANKFCGQQNAIICPYDAICPLGHGAQPIGGYDGWFELSWVPIADKADDWVQHSRDNACTRYSSEHSDPPKWGIIGDYEGVDMVSHVMCCAISPDEAPNDTNLDGSFIDEIGPSLWGLTANTVLGDPGHLAFYQSVVATYAPMEYNRSQGWWGHTYVDALEFCDKMNGYQICPYDAICPLGTEASPLLGYYEEEEAWVPILDRTNEYVQLGTLNPCVKYSHLYGDIPSWINTGKYDENITQHVICCMLIGDNVEEEDGGSGDLGEGSFDEKQDEPLTLEIEYETSEVYGSSAAINHPMLYSRDQGWGGHTYAQAHDFCVEIAVDYGSYGICPFEAICPLGLGTKALGRHNIDNGETWMPVSDRDNVWVRVDDSNPCILSSGENQNTPKWTNAGYVNEETTRFIACCLLLDGDDEGSKNDGEQNDEDENIHLSAYTAVGRKYMPKQYGRGNGWTGQTYAEAISFCGQHGSLTICPYEAICPMGPLSKPFIGYKEEDGSRGMWVPVINDNTINAWVQVSSENSCLLHSNDHGESLDWGPTGDDDLTRHIVCCAESNVIVTDAGSTEAKKQSEQVGKAYSDALTYYQPIGYAREDGWAGKTYSEAVKFCARNEGYGICPFGALCPLGTGSKPSFLFDANADDGPTWVPISDHSNGWVNLNADNTCPRYVANGPKGPNWGTPGENSEELEELTSYIVCCKVSIYEGAEVDFLYEVAGEKYHPLWYDRSNGWIGQTHDEAVEFCVKKKRMSLCPYSAYCPMADLNLPIGGVKDDGDSGGVWAPVRDASNWWISVGSNNTCEDYFALNGEDPEWGIAGIGNEEITRHIMCCSITEGEDDGSVNSKGTVPVIRLPTSFPTSFPSGEPTPSPTPLPSNKPTLPPISGAMDLAVESYKTAEKYNPVWYDRSSGWTGETYDKAFAFCSKKGSNHDICPYEVICPGGPLSLPYGGSKPAPTSWAPINEAFNSWVQVSDQQLCIRYEDLNDEDYPTWGLTGIDVEDITRHIACCDMRTAKLNDVAIPVIEKYAPKWFDRDEGWDGTSYVDAIEFCASKDSFIPCPYEAYCPEGEGSLPTGGQDWKEEAWAAIMDVPNGWVQIGSYGKNSISNSCMDYNSLHETPPLWGLFGDASTDMTPRIMCCKEPRNGIINEIAVNNGNIPMLSVATANTKNEQAVLEEMHPVWFGREHGYRGTTWAEASDFCEAIGDMVLCPRRAYCPDEENKLFLKKNPFGGEQWAPATSKSNTAEIEYWVSIGENLDTCATHEELQVATPGWVLAGNQEELKENILCCQNPKYLAKEESYKKEFNPIWMDASHGWDGGSHDEAIQFCKDFGMRELCPYAAYCPHGPGQSAMGGHATDFNTEGEQWAPVYGGTNNWVMIGQKYQNRATMCMNSEELEGVMPDWGMSKGNANLKKYIMCC